MHLILKQNKDAMVTFDWWCKGEAMQVHMNYDGGSRKPKKVTAKNEGG